MNNKVRIASILRTESLDTSVSNLISFHLSDLILDNNLEFELAQNVRLGHLAEKVVSGLIKSSSNYKVLYENIQVIEEKTTIGEIDFILENLISKQLIHVELAYKFYLFDPNISTEAVNNWIGPNRNDSLIDRLEKLKKKQFPLLHHKAAKTVLNNIDIDEVSQALCLLVSLFIPYEYKGSFNPVYKKAIKGYYLNFENFSALNNAEKTYHIPSKKEWGIEPSENNTWTHYNGIEEQIKTHLKEKQAPLIWQKIKDSYIAFFIVWW